MEGVLEDGRGKQVGRVGDLIDVVEGVGMWEGGCGW